ncbi:hypothetical protein BGW42_000944 [Actinomortierella wolfii]|nr:hypothetical protein BGW42_000944 [Actinomortierella wolfii]
MKFSAVLAVLAAAVAVQAAPTPVRVPTLDSVQLAKLGITTPVEITVTIDPDAHPIISVETNPDLPVLKPVISGVEAMVDTVLGTLPIMTLEQK